MKDLNSLLVGIGLPMDDATFTSTPTGTMQGLFRGRFIKVKALFLKKFLPQLQAVLQTDEVIKYGMSSFSPAGLLTQLTLGHALQQLRSCFLVFTDRRMLHFPLTLSLLTKKPTKMQAISEVWYGDVESCETGGLLQKGLQFKYKNGKKEWLQLRGGELKPIASFLSNTIRNGVSSASKGRHFLCPKCYEPLSELVRMCPKCALPFKTLSKATWLSILVPGGGYFYTKHLIMGSFFALLELILLLQILGSLSGAFLGNRPEAVANSIGFTIVFVLETLASIVHARYFVREFIPAEEAGSGQTTDQKRDFTRPLAIHPS